MKKSTTGIATTGSGKQGNPVTKYNNSLPIVKKILPIDSHPGAKYQKSILVVKMLLPVGRALEPIFHKIKETTDRENRTTGRYRKK